MKILVVGPSGCYQRGVLENLGIDAKLPDIPQGVCLEHRFTSKYFEQLVGVWVDEFEDWGEWSANFASPEAKEVRQALLMVILCLPKGSLDQLKYLTRFITTLKQERPGVVVCGVCEFVAGPEDHESAYELGIDVMEGKELLDSVYSAIIDWDEGVGTLGDQEPFEEPKSLLEPLIDLESMVDRLRIARDGSMSENERMALAEQLAKELVP